MKENQLHSNPFTGLFLTCLGVNAAEGLFSDRWQH